MTSRSFRSTINVLLASSDSNASSHFKEPSSDLQINFRFDFARFEHVIELLDNRQRYDILVIEVGRDVDQAIKITDYVRLAIPEIKIVYCKLKADFSVFEKLLGTGANGYLDSSSNFQEINLACDVAIKNGVYVSSSLQNLSASYLPNRTNLNMWKTLTERERQVVTLLSEGFKNKEIAEILDLSVRTIEAHRRSMKHKIELHKLSDLVKFVNSIGLSELAAYYRLIR